MPVDIKRQQRKGTVQHPLVLELFKDELCHSDRRCAVSTQRASRLAGLGQVEHYIELWQVRMLLHFQPPIEFQAMAYAHFQHMASSELLDIARHDRREHALPGEQFHADPYQPRTAHGVLERQLRRAQRQVVECHLFGPGGRLDEVFTLDDGQSTTLIELLDEIGQQGIVDGIAA